MSNSPLDKLKQIFTDCPEVLKLLDLNYFDEDNLQGEAATEEYRKGDGFAAPVNLYVTGRTRAGKSSLGNTLFDQTQPVLEVRGHMDCTDRVNCFRLLSNLSYFDLPGAGSLKEKYENINRVALLIPQIESRRSRLSNISEFILSDYTNYFDEQKSKDQVVTVAQWQSSNNQELYAPDVILYVIAPHEGFGRDDENYLFDLLKSWKERIKRNIVVFALNLHLIDGKPRYTPQNIEDVRKIITESYQDVYSDPQATPPIVEINSLTGAGVNKITEEICKILPVDKLGKMEQVLQVKLKEIARTQRSRRYREALIYIASRLATRKVDESLGEQDLLLEAYAAVYYYGIKVFQKENPSEDLYGIIDSFARNAKKSKEKKVTVMEPVFKPRELKTTIQVPKFGKITETQEVLVQETYLAREKRSNPFMQLLLGDKERVMPKKPYTKILKSESFGITGTEDKEQSIGEIQEVVDTKEKVVGTNYLKGGYSVIEGLLSIGLGIEKVASEDNIQTDIASVYQSGRRILESTIANYNSRIEELVDSRSPQQAEKEIIQILSKALLS